VDPAHRSRDGGRGTRESEPAPTARQAGKSPGTLETYRWPVYKLLLPAYEREGIDSATKIKQRFLDRVNAEPLDAGLSPASVPLVPSAASVAAVEDLALAEDDRLQESVLAGVGEELSELSGLSIGSSGTARRLGGARGRRAVGDAR